MPTATDTRKATSTTGRSSKMRKSRFQQRDKRIGGFALMDPEQVAELGRVGGVIAQRSGRAHRLTRAERARGGRIGGAR